jgi:DNA-binding CsgD family transcriptional regulator
VESIGEQLGRVLERQRGQEQQRQAVAISNALNLTIIRSEALEATLNAFATAVYLTDRHSRIVYMNRAAESQVSTSDVIRVANGHFAPTSRMARVALTKVIEEAIGDGADPVTSSFSIALNGGDSAGLIATVLPLAHGALSGIAAIFVQDPRVMPPFQGEAFAKLYGLTKSELSVLLAMAPGLCIREAAGLLGIGETTAKTHLQHIYFKTGTSKQTELMRLVMSSTPPVGAGANTGPFNSWAVSGGEN